MINQIQQATIVEILPTKIWIENDMFGARHVVLQHATCGPFTYATFWYGYGYTSNSGTLSAANALALQLGAMEPLEYKDRPMAPMPSQEELRERIAQMQSLLDDHPHPNGVS